MTPAEQRRMVGYEKWKATRQWAMANILLADLSSDDEELKEYRKAMREYVFRERLTGLSLARIAQMIGQPISITTCMLNVFVWAAKDRRVSKWYRTKTRGMRKNVRLAFHRWHRDAFVPWLNAGGGE